MRCAEDLASNWLVFVQAKELQSFLRVSELLLLLMILIQPLLQCITIKEIGGTTFEKTNFSLKEKRR